MTVEGENFIIGEVGDNQPLMLAVKQAIIIGCYLIEKGGLRGSMKCTMKLCIPILSSDISK